MATIGVTSERRDGVLLIRLHRPESRNSLSNEVLEELARILAEADVDDVTRAAVIAGSEKVFASGADLRDIAQHEATELYFGGRFRSWDGIRRTRIPLVAAVSGFCLGGGMELAMMCDVIVAAEGARFGLPETSLGLIPGAGGTQRLARAIGKAKTMEVILAGRLLTARDAEAAGLVARVTTPDDWLDEGLRVAQEIAKRSPVAVRLAKEAVNRSFDAGLESGLDVERKAFTVAFGAADAREGIAAFLEKREPRW
jgi:enoyl-CoA hydratase